jgi:LysM repeat protein
MKRYWVVLALVLLLALTTVGIASAAPDGQGGPVIHYVGFGDSLVGIAARYGVSVEAIMAANGLFNPDMIYAGQPLRIPSGYGAPAPLPGPGYGGCGNSHTVVAGETLSSIAYRYGVPLEALLSSNQLYNRDMVFVGQRICLPGAPGYAHGPVGYPPAGPAAYYHTVVRGDTLSNICQRYGVDYQSVMRSNNLANASFIWVGQRLSIPGYYPAPPPAGLPPAPPAKPYYDDAYNDAPPPSPPAPYDSSKPVPSAPDYSPSAARPDLPLASQPIEVVVNGGSSWVGTAFEGVDDPNGITTLVVGTHDKTAARTVRIRSGDYEVKGELGLAPEFGVDKFRFAFKYIPPGSYDVWIDDPEVPSNKVQVQVAAGQRIEVDFHEGLAFSGPTYASSDGWFLANWDNPSKPGQNIGGWSNILVQAPASGLWIMIESEGKGYQAKCFTGSKGPGQCDLAGLNAGIYYLWIDGTQLTIKTYLDGNAYAFFEFGRQAVPGEENKIGPVNYN